MPINRRRFVKHIGIYTSLGILFLNACKNSFSGESDYYALTDNQSNLLQQIHTHLFPSEENSPGAKDINSVNFIKKILLDPQVNKKDKRLILFGVNWTNDTAKEFFQKPFIDLDQKEKETVLLDLVSYRNGERWISKNITYIFEALLSDPIYGSNTNQIGWKWLNHQTGYPRPSETTKYQYL